MFNPPSRFASTAPWYVETPSGTQRISEGSAKFFLDWVKERTSRVKQNLQDDPGLATVLQPHLKAHSFWQAKVRSANANRGQPAQGDIESTSLRSVLLNGR